MRYVVEPLLYLGFNLDLDVVEVPIRPASDVDFLGELGGPKDAAVPGLDSPFGGCGNEAMLMVFRIV